MRTLTVFSLLLVIMQLSAQSMHFDDYSTIPITSGTYSFSELKNYQGDERILVYSQTYSSVYVSVYDTEGSFIETYSLTKHATGSDQKMTYYEYDGAGYLVVSRTVGGPNENSTSYYADIYSMNTCSFDQSIICKTWNNNESCKYTVTLQQPVATYSEGVDDVVLCIPTGCFYRYESLEPPDYPWFTDDGQHLTMIHIEDNTPSLSSYNDRSACIITGDVPTCPAVTYGWYYLTDWSGPEYYESFLHAVGVSGDFPNYTGSFPVSDHYPAEPESVTLSWGQSGIREYSLNWELIWSSAETHLRRPAKPSCCFSHYTVYFDGYGNNTAYEIRDRLDGSILDWGDIGWKPDYINRLENGSLIMLKGTSSGVQMKHASVTPLAINMTPAMNLTSTGVHLAWDEVESALSYKVYVSDRPNGGYQLVGTTDELFFDHAESHQSKRFYRISVEY